MKFRFLGCEGFALQVDSNIQKITEGIYDTSTDASVIYLLTEKGDIKCSIPATKSNYENFDNQDRRQLNIANGFNVLWDRDSPICTIFYHPKKDGCGCSVISSIICFFLGCFVGWLFSYYIISPSSYNIADINKLQNDNQWLMEQKDSLEISTISLQKQKDSIQKELLLIKDKKDSFEKEISSSKESYNEADVAFVKSLFLKVNKHSFYSYVAIPNTLIGEAVGSTSTKERWLTTPNKYFFKTNKSKDGFISGQYSVNGGTSYTDLTVNGNSRDINDVSRYTCLLFNKMGVMKEFESKGHYAIDYINERRFLADHKE